MTNRGDRPIQVGSHYPFAETNRALVFDRAPRYGMRLDIPAGTAVRFEPGETKTVRSSRSAARASCAAATPGRAVAQARRTGSGTCHEPPHRPAALRRHFGPTTGDRVRLGDTALVAEVERDFAVYGDECKFGGGKVLRDGMGQARRRRPTRDALDCVITNALDHRLDRHLQGRHRHQGRPHRRHRQGRATRT